LAPRWQAICQRAAKEHILANYLLPLLLRDELRLIKTVLARRA